MSEQTNRYWLGVAALDHVEIGVAGGFCQLGHGKEAPIRRLASGDWLAYYAPRSTLDGGAAVQAFVALGRIKRGEAYRGDMGHGFHPWRRDVAWKKRAKAAPIHPLLERLALTKGRRSWGIVLRRSLIELSQDDLDIIAQAMGVRRPGTR